MIARLAQIWITLLLMSLVLAFIGWSTYGLAGVIAHYSGLPFWLPMGLIWITIVTTFIVSAEN